MRKSHIAACATLLSFLPLTLQANTTFNPDISIILDGGYFQSDHEGEEYEIPGFTLGGEAGLPEQGFSIGHSELVMSSNIDDKFYGQITTAFAEHDGETEIEIEEAYIETTSLGNGLKLRAGRFFPHIGYLNEKHNHAWDFADAPLIYAGLWGNKYIDDGLSVNWVAPTDIYMEIGADLLSGGRFPGGAKSDGVGTSVLYTKFGGDVGVSHSWQASLHYYSSDIEDREAGGHAHGHGHEEDESEEEHSDEVAAFSGDSNVGAVSLLYKWAPDGNFKQKNVTLQMEYFKRDEDGTITMEGSDPLEESTYTGEHSGYYIQAAYQFMPTWRTGVRYDYLTSTHNGGDEEVLEESGHTNEGIDPERFSVMLEWLPSEFSRVRFQYNRDDTFQSDNQFYIQYTMSLGAHGAHSF